MVWFFIIAGILLRLVPHPPNFAPIAALALFGGCYLNKKYALVVPLAAMLFSDIFLGFAEFWVMFSVYLSFVLIGFLGLWLKKHKNPTNTVGVTLSGSLLFFILTNFAVWAATGWYSKTFHGLIQSYWMAIPFFKNTILGDLFYVGVMFGLYELINYLIARRLLWQKQNLKSYQRPILSKK